MQFMLGELERNPISLMRIKQNQIIEINVLFKKISSMNLLGHGQAVTLMKDFLLAMKQLLNLELKKGNKSEIMILRLQKMH